MAGSRAQSAAIAAALCRHHPPAAAGGGLAGAWLGFNATDGLLALITAIVGATVGANLILLALDISWDRQARDRVDGTNAAEAKAHAATH